jgi:hypothetical protein
MTAIAKVVLSPPALFRMVQWNRYTDQGKTISMMGMINFWPEKKSNIFLSIEGSRHFPRVWFLFEQSYISNLQPTRKLRGSGLISGLSLSGCRWQNGGWRRWQWHNNGCCHDAILPWWYADVRQCRERQRMMTVHPPHLPSLEAILRGGGGSPTSTNGVRQHTCRDWQQWHGERAATHRRRRRQREG